MPIEENDIYLTEAAKIFNKKPEEVTEEERKQAKAICFGSLYSNPMTYTAVQTQDEAL